MGTRHIQALLISSMGLVSALISTTTHAGTVTYAISGTVSGPVSASLTPYFVAGEAFSGYLTLDDSVPSALINANALAYANGLVSGSVTLGGVSVTASSGTVQSQISPGYNMWNAVAGSIFGAGGTVGVTGASGLTANGWNYQMGSSAGTAFSATAFPTGSAVTNLSLYDLNARQLNLYFLTGSTTTSLTLQVTSAAAVPLPAAAWLLLSGLGGLAATMRRRPTRCTTPI